MKAPAPTRSGEPPVFELRGISKIYPMGESEVRALDEVDLQIHEGEFVAILGQSGSGKSTLMNILGFMDQPTTGQIFLDGKRMTRLGESGRARIRGRKIGFVFQAFNLLSRLTVLENTTLPLQYQQHSARAVKQRGREMLELVGLGDRVDHYPNQLSGGQRQRVAIARALVNRPRLILADEPTGNLDTENAGLILDLFQQLHDEGGRTFVLVTHDSLVASRTNRRIIMEDGRIVEEGA